MPSPTHAPRKAFTLIELLVVVVIIGVLTAIAIPRFGNSKDKSYVGAQQTDIRNAAAAMELVQDAQPTIGYTGGVTRAIADSLVLMQPYYSSSPGDTVYIDSVAPATGYRVRAHHYQLNVSNSQCTRVGTLSDGFVSAGNQIYGVSAGCSP